MTLPSGWITKLPDGFGTPCISYHTLPADIETWTFRRRNSGGTVHSHKLSHLSRTRQRTAPQSVGMNNCCERFEIPRAVQNLLMQPCRDKTVSVFLARNLAVSSCRSSGTLLLEIWTRELTPVVGYELADPPDYLAWQTTFVLPNLHAILLFSGNFGRTRVC